jgi:hypothetical protein
VTLVERPGELGREVRACGVQRRREGSADSGEDAGALSDGQLGSAAEGLPNDLSPPGASPDLPGKHAVAGPASVSVPDPSVSVIVTVTGAVSHRPLVTGAPARSSVTEASP